jgi:hypothetical protein
MSEIYAPVLIPTLCRFTHLKRCIDSLKRNSYAKYTPLYIALDYPAKEIHREGYNHISNYLNNLNGFLYVKVIYRDKNFGPEKNVFEARKILLEKYDRIIFSEDDNEFSPNFLEFINKGLNKFEKNANIFAICGYNYPINIQSSNDYYFCQSLFCMGIWNLEK